MYIYIRKSFDFENTFTLNTFRMDTVKADSALKKSMQSTDYTSKYVI